MVGNGACANVRSRAVPLGGCRERWCEFFVGAVPLGFVCAGVSGDVEEAGIRWGATAGGGGEGV